MNKCIVFDVGNPVAIYFELGDPLAFLQQLARNQDDLVVGKIPATITLITCEYPSHQFGSM